MPLQTVYLAAYAAQTAAVGASSVAMTALGGAVAGIGGSGAVAVGGVLASTALASTVFVVGWVWLGASIVGAAFGSDVSRLFAPAYTGSHTSANCNQSAKLNLGHWSISIQLHMCMSVCPACVPAWPPCLSTYVSTCLYAGRVA